MELITLILIIIIVLFLTVAVIFRKEIHSTRERDPSATGIIEIALTYSGLHALILHRMANGLWQMKVPFLPRFLSQFNRWLTGIEIHPAARIGAGLFIDHGMGVVIGETSIVGDNVTIFQGVTLGGTGKEKGKRHPNIEDNVVIGAGAKVLGNIVIGKNSYVGANAVVISDVPPNSTVVGVPGHVTKQDGNKIERTLDHIHVLDPITQTLDELRKKVEFLENRIKEGKDNGSKDI